jgi:predicted ATP-binding protein involved in virulence
MKITRIKWKNHPILGNLFLDLTNSNTNEPYETIIFAGENGTGKSTILEELSSFLNLGPFINFEFIEYIVLGKTYKAIPTSDGTTHPNFFDLEDASGNITRIRSDKNNNRSDLDSNPIDLRHYGCVFSRARSDYKTKKITTTSTSTLDTEKYDIDKNDDFTSLKQLIVDVVNQDNSNYMETNKALGSAPKSWDDFYQTSKIYRFKNSFDSFFENLTYDKVADEAGEKTIKFTKNNRSIVVDKLSTGEKQIVFRGIYLLKNGKLLQDAAIMIDEPELSMHPKWQKKILQYYKSLFTQNGNINAQLFFATHSDHVLKEALENKGENVVIILENSGGSIQMRKIDAPSVLPSITSAETNYLAFDLASNDYHIELYGWLQEKKSKGSIKSCDDFIKIQPQYDSAIHSNPSTFGSMTYSTLPTYIRNAIHHPDSGNHFSEAQLRTSIKLLIELCK